MDRIVLSPVVQRQTVAIRAPEPGIRRVRAAAEMAEIAAAPEEADTARPDSTAVDGDGRLTRQLTDQDRAPVTPPPSGSGGAPWTRCAPGKR